MARPTETLSPALPSDVEQLALKVLQTAVDAEETLATAESCTGGLLASLLTDVDGCGHCFDRGFVVYTEDAKKELLGVPGSILDSFGAVSRETAEAMVTGALSKSHADVGVAITGYAGPAGPGDEAGLVYIAAARRREQPRVTEHHFGDVGRGEVRLRCLRAALELVLEKLCKPSA